MKRTLLYTLFFSIGFLSFSQNQKYVPGEILVKLDGHYTGKSLVNDFKNTQIQLSNPVLVSKTLNIWKFNFDDKKLKMNDVIQSTSKNNSTRTVQVNHIIKKRATIPDDTDYDRQWQYFQENDKDIDADEAWDITTGGMTANGHEIVY